MWSNIRLWINKRGLFKDERSRSKASHYFLNLGTPAVEPLIAVLDQEMENVRTSKSAAASTACRLLGELKAVEAICILNKALHYNQDSYLRKDAEEAIGLIGKAYPKQVADVLLPQLTDPRQYTPSVIRAVGLLGDKRAVELLIEILTTKWPPYRNSASAEYHIYDERATAAEALGNIGDRRAVQPLATVLGVAFYQYTHLPCNAARALAKIGDASAIPYLQETLRKTVWEAVRNAVKEALLSLGTDMDTQDQKIQQ
jgi:HEAT repeat protein